LELSFGGNLGQSRANEKGRRIAPAALSISEALCLSRRFLLA
jgi:hypothetical protein